MEALNVPIVAPQRGLDFSNPSALEAAQKACSYFVNSDLVPASYSAAKVGDKKAVANTIIALDYSLRLGVSPLAMMQNLDIIQGRPSLSSKFLVGTINTCGRYETIRYAVGIAEGGVFKNKVQVIGKDGKPLQNMWCYAYTWEKGIKFENEEDRKNKCLKSTKITMQMAVDEGWYDKSGSKWQTMPSQMLKYRAASFWCRAYAPELSLGMYTTEEVKDSFVEDVDYEVIDTNVGTTDTSEPEPPKDSLAARAERIKAENEAKAKAIEQAGDLFKDQAPETK